MRKGSVGNKNAQGTIRAKGEDAPDFKGGWLSGNGYKYRYVYTFGEKRQIPVHRHIMEQHLGRKLESHEHIDHINGDKLDNKIENLRLTDIKGNNHYYWGITDKDEQVVIERLNEGKTYRECIQGTNIKSIATVLRIKRSYGLA